MPAWEIAVGAVLILISLSLIVLILLQQSKSQGLSGAIAGGAETFFGKKRGLDEKLARVSACLAVLFMLVPVIMAVLER